MLSHVQANAVFSRVPLFGKNQKHSENPQTVYQPLKEQKPLDFPLNPSLQGNMSDCVQYYKLKFLAVLRKIPVFGSKIPVPYLGDGKAVLDKLAATSRYCFHGSKRTTVLQELVPSQPDHPIVLDTGEKRFHTEMPKTWLSPFPLVAVFNATLRDRKMAGWRTFLDWEKENAFIVPDAAPDYLQSVLKSELPKGIVYLFDRKNSDIQPDFLVDTELSATKKLKPIGYVTVSVNDLPFDVRSLPSCANPFNPEYKEEEIRRFFQTVGYSDQEIENLWPILQKNTQYWKQRKP